jgi:hypothetical protein
MDLWISAKEPNGPCVMLTSLASWDELRNHNSFLPAFCQTTKVYVELGSLVMKFSLPPFQLPTSFNCDKIVVFATFSTLSNQLH